MGVPPYKKGWEPLTALGGLHIDINTTITIIARQT